MRRTVLALPFLLLVVPAYAYAAATPRTTATVAPFEVSGWIPYWRKDAGTLDTLAHLHSLNTVMPFGYIVQNDGSIHDAFELTNPSATSSVRTLVQAAKTNRVRMIPTVMWSNGAAIDTVLRSTTQRRALEANIADLVKTQGFDGVDIDFENKKAETRPYFSLFLKGLYALMGNKFVYCSIEPRTPPTSYFAVIPTPLEYANDYSAINKYCDRVEIMAYDQGRVDLKLNALASTSPYIPVADIAWVEKVVNFASQTISKKKILIGAATYGYEYDIIPLTQGNKYDLDWTFNPRYGTTLASELGITPQRTTGGELSFIYTPTTTPKTMNATTTPKRIVWWSDARAIHDKVQLAHKLGVRGVAIFKLDGGEDPTLWTSLSAR